MARRSASNERYRVETKGQTRKSAGSVKPKRPAGTVDKTRPEPAIKKKPAGKAKRTYTPLPSTPEIKKWRKIWWVLIVLAFGGFLLYFYGAKEGSRNLEVAGLSLELAGVLLAVNIDIFVIRKLRKEAMSGAKGGKTKKSKEAGGKDLS